MATDGRPTLLVTDEVAQLLHLSRRTLADWRANGKGPDYIKMGTGKSARVLYDLTDVELWLSRMGAVERQ